LFPIGRGGTTTAAVEEGKRRFCCCCCCCWCWSKCARVALTGLPVFASTLGAPHPTPPSIGSATAACCPETTPAREVFEAVEASLPLALRVAFEPLVIAEMWICWCPPLPGPSLRVVDAEEESCDVFPRFQSGLGTGEPATSMATGAWLPRSLPPVIAAASAAVVVAERPALTAARNSFIFCLISPSLRGVGVGEAEGRPDVLDPNATPEAERDVERADTAASLLSRAARGDVAPEVATEEALEPFTAAVGAGPAVEAAAVVVSDAGAAVGAAAVAEVESVVAAGAPFAAAIASAWFRMSCALVRGFSRCTHSRFMRTHREQGRFASQDDFTLWQDTQAISLPAYITRGAVADPPVLEAASPFSALLGDTGDTTPALAAPVAAAAVARTLRVGSLGVVEDEVAAEADCSDFVAFEGDTCACCPCCDAFEAAVAARVGETASRRARATRLLLRARTGLFCPPPAEKFSAATPAVAEVVEAEEGDTTPATAAAAAAESRAFRVGFFWGDTSATTEAVVVVAGTGEGMSGGPTSTSSPRTGCAGVKGGRDPIRALRGMMVSPPRTMEVVLVMLIAAAASDRLSPLVLVEPRRWCAPAAGAGAATADARVEETEAGPITTGLCMGVADKASRDVSAEVGSRSIGDPNAPAPLALPMPMPIPRPRPPLLPMGCMWNEKLLPPAEWEWGRSMLLAGVCANDL